MKAVTASQYQVSSLVFWTPDYNQTDPRVCIPNFYCPQVASPPFEIACEAGRKIQGCSLQIGSKYYPLTFGGSTSHAFAEGERYIWSDRLKEVTLFPANTSIRIITADYTPIGQKRPLGYNPAVAIAGDRVAQGSTTQSAYLTSGTVPVPAFGQLAMGPIAIVAIGAPNSRPVALVVGDSIGWRANHYTMTPHLPRGNYGYVNIGLDDDTSGVGRFAHGNFCVGSTNFHSLRNLDGYWQIRNQLLADVGYPFTCILCEHVNNNVGGGYAAMVATADAAWAFLESMGNRKLVQTTANPLTSADASGNFYSLVSSQSASAANTYPTGERWRFVEYVKGLPPNVDAVIDVTPYFVDPVSVDRWKEMGRQSVLVADVSSGMTFQVTGTPPIAGDDVVIGAGGAGAIQRTISAVTGMGPHTCTIATGSRAISGTFRSGRIVRATPSTDGIHPGGSLHTEAAQAVVAAKQAGIFV